MKARRVGADRRDEANSRFALLRTRQNAVKLLLCWIVTLWRLTRVWIYSCVNALPWHWVEEKVQLYASADSPLGKEIPVPKMILKVEAELSVCTQWSWGMAPVILNLSTIRVLRWVVSLTFRPLYSRWSGVKFLVTGCLSLLDKIQIVWSLLLVWLFRLTHSFIFFGCI